MDIISVKDPKQFNVSQEIRSIINNSMVLMKQGRFNDAVSVCDEGLKMDSTNALILTQKGAVCSRLGRFDLLVCLSA